MTGSTSGVSQISSILLYFQIVGTRSVVVAPVPETFFFFFLPMFLPSSLLEPGASRKEVLSIGRKWWVRLIWFKF